MSIDKISMERMFPAPREVDRFLYRTTSEAELRYTQVSGPSRGRQVLIRQCICRRESPSLCVSGPSRGRQVLILWVPFFPKKIEKIVSVPSRGGQVLILHYRLSTVFLQISFRPLSRQIGSYTLMLFIALFLLLGFRPLSRQIGSYTNQQNYWHKKA